MAFVRLLKDLMRDKEFGKRIVPIIPDEARTFGMDSFFSTIKIYNPHGQNYTPVDAELMLAYREAKDGQILHLGINEAGSMAAFTAVGSSYATHGEPMIPLYIFYSMFGFQRTGDSIWAAADQMTRGFLIGATAGRTTLTGEGLQHADGHSPLLASTNPAVVHYDPAFSYEIAHIMQDGLHRMYGTDDSLTDEQRNVIYYLTVYNEPMVQPAEPENVDREGLLKGLYLYAEGSTDGLADDAPRVQLLASGVGMPWALEAQELLRNDWHVVADVWSVTSWNELRRDGLRCDEKAFLEPESEAPVPWVTQKLRDRKGPVVAVSDYMRAVQDQIRQWVPGDFTSLGADGFGFSDTRPAARRFFHIDGPSMAVRALQALAERGEVDRSVPLEAARRYRLSDVTAGLLGQRGRRQLMLLAFSIAPATPAEGGSYAEAVAGAVRVVRESGLPNETTSMFTTVEGEWDEVMDVLKRCVDTMTDAGAERVSLVVKADIRPGHSGMLEGKVARVEDVLATG